FQGSPGSPVSPRIAPALGALWASSPNRVAAAAPVLAKEQVTAVGPSPLQPRPRRAELRASLKEVVLLLTQALQQLCEQLRSTQRTNRLLEERRDTYVAQLAAASALLAADKAAHLDESLQLRDATAESARVEFVSSVAEVTATAAAVATAARAVEVAEDFKTTITPATGEAPRPRASSRVRLSPGMAVGGQAGQWQRYRHVVPRSTTDNDTNNSN
ncbi:unnamed protein product, partial [Polarella glacialis]